MTRPPINPGRVEWSGENPGIYLRSAPGADYSALALFFRVRLSPHGTGTAGLVLAAPDRAEGWPDAANFILTDNQRMMRWIVDGWVRHMPTFRGRAALDAMRWLDLTAHSTLPRDPEGGYEVTLHGAEGVRADLVWRDPGPPLPVEVGPADSATGRHEMYSVFMEAAGAEIRINGAPLPGAVGERTFFGRIMSTAFLAFSETWITPGGGQEDTV